MNNVDDRSMWKSREEYKQRIADHFVNILQEKGLEWKKGWVSDQISPISESTGKPYKGINALYLYLIQQDRQLKDPRWLTAYSINVLHKDDHYHIKKGAQGTWIECWKVKDLVTNKLIDLKDANSLLKSGERSSKDLAFRCKPIHVFNASDVEGIEPYKSVTKKNYDISLSDMVHKISENMKVSIIHDGGNKAYYNPTEDKIHLPKEENFVDAYELDSTAMHELSHATGHESRLNRNLKNFFGSDEYAFEELIAEMSSCFMCVDLKQSEEHLNNHKAYVQSWIENIAQKPNVLLEALNEAKKAANYLELKAEIINQKEYEESLNNTIKIDTEDTPSHAKIIEDAIRETGKKPLNLRDYQAKAKAYNVQRNHNNKAYTKELGER